MKNTELDTLTKTVVQTFANFGIKMKVTKAYAGFTSYHIRMIPTSPVRMHEIKSYVDDLRFATGEYVIKIEAPLKLTKEVEVSIIKLGRPEEIAWSKLYDNPELTEANEPLTVPLGMDEEGGIHFIDIARLPHMLMGGRSFVGKTNFLHSVIHTLILRNGPDKVRLVLADPEKNEFAIYKNLPHLLTAPIDETRRVVRALQWAVTELERRYDVLEAAEVTNIMEYHAKATKEQLKTEPMPYVVFVCDEFADVMSEYGDIAEKYVIKLTQLSRAVGIHLILSTQSHEARIVRGAVKANLPARLAFASYSEEASIAIIDYSGSESLQGIGLVLFQAESTDFRAVAIQTGKISMEEIKANILTVKRRYNAVDEDGVDLKTLEDYKFAISEGDEEDDLYTDAKTAVIEAGKASTSYIQRKLRVGYSRAARLMDMLEERGVIGPADGSAPREILED